MSSPASWNAGRYMQFASERTQPSVDLIARIPVAHPHRIVDLGCGPGNSTAMLKARWPGADIEGIDSSAEMLERARADHPSLLFAQADIADWTPNTQYDLVFSNATLQWLPDHATLYPRLLQAVAPGGCFAVQIPNNRESPSQSVFRAMWREPEWQARHGGADHGLRDIHPAGFYYDVLRPLVATLEIWETLYQHVLDGPEAVVDFVRSTALRGYLDRLSPEDGAAFLAEGTRRLAEAMPRQADGKVLFQFRRMFLVATR